MAARRFSEAQWREIIQSFEGSSSTQEAFASEHGIPISSFRAWLYRVRESKRQVEAGFIELRPQASAAYDKSVDEKDCQVCVELADGVRIVFDHRPPIPELAELVRQLSGHRSC